MKRLQRPTLIIYPHEIAPHLQMKFTNNNYEIIDYIVEKWEKIEIQNDPNSASKHVVSVIK